MKKLFIIIFIVCLNTNFAHAGMSEALIHKYGYAEGLTITDNIIVEWPETLNGGVKPTQVEIDTAISEYAPLEKWKEDMAVINLSDDLENIIAAMDAPARTRIADETLDKYNAKKSLRLSKP